MTVADTAPALPAGTGSVLSVVYSSRATIRFSDADLAMLLAASRMRNESRGLTGLLLHRDGRFMQVLEGFAPTVRRVLADIAADTRHTDLAVLDEEHLDERRFASWAMGYRSMTAAEVDEWFGSAEATRDVGSGSRAADLLERFRAG